VYVESVRVSNVAHELEAAVYFISVIVDPTMRAPHLSPTAHVVDAPWMYPPVVRRFSAVGVAWMT
jgi:hypothetical protein